MNPSNLPQRIRNHLIWRSWQTRKLSGRLAARSGWLGRRVRWPIPGSAPYRWPHLHLARDVAMGDVLLCTPALRELKQINPNCHVTFYTKFTSLLDGLPFIDAVRPTEEAPPGTINLRYEESLPPRRHLAKVLGDYLGFEVRDVRPACVVNLELAREFLQTLRDLPRPWIIVNRRASSWTPNKDWPDARWDELIDRLVKWSTVVEVGSVLPAGVERDPDRHLNLVGRLSLDELVAVIAAADLNVGPISGPVHIAAAFAVPSVVIFGGYEHPVCTHYPGNLDFFSAVPCAPCWLRDPCPIGKICLERISPASVEESLGKLWGRGPRRRDARLSEIHQK